MDKRRMKQLIYGLIYIAAWAAILTGFYFVFVKPPPSCFDSIKNQNEEGIDCGVVCGNICIPADIQTLTVSGGGVRSFVTGGGHYTFLVQIANKNSGFAARSFDYDLNLRGVSGDIIQTISGYSFAYAGELKYLVFPNVTVLGSLSNAEFVIKNIDWVKAAVLGIVPQFAVQNAGAGALSANAITVNGQISDRDVASFNNVVIVAVFRGANGSTLGASQTQIDSIAPNETKNFSVMYPAVPNLDPSLTQFFAYAFRQ